jgi:hypothetical protein
MEDVGLLIFAILRTPYWVFVVLTFLYIKLRGSAVEVVMLAVCTVS